MADYAFGGNDEEIVELKKLNAEVVRCCFHSHPLTIEADTFQARRW